MAAIDQTNPPPRGGSSIARPMQHVGKLRQWMTAGAVLLALLPGLFGIIRPEAVSAQVVTTTEPILSAPGNLWTDGGGNSGYAACASAYCSDSPWGFDISYEDKQRVRGATWIWKETDTDQAVEHVVTFSKSFDIPEDASDISATMSITADNAYEVSLNGFSVGGDGSMALDTIDDSPFSWESVETYPLSAVPGGNDLTILVANYAVQNGSDNPAGLIYRIDLAYSQDVTDTTAPTVTPPASVSVNATGPDGAFISYPDATDTDDRPGPLTIGCNPASDAVFPIGTTTVTCTATDVAGNIGSASFDVTVLGASGQLANLTSSVQGYNLHQGISNSLDTELSNAQRALDAARAGDLASACGLMGAFINEVKAQADQKLTVPQSETLIIEASRIAAVLGC